MSDDNDTEYDADGNEIEAKPENANIRKLREKAERADAAEAKNAKLERELAFSKAGLPDTPQVRYFQETYTGDPDPEAIKAAALAAEFITPEPDPNAPTDDERNGVEQIQAAAAGGNEVVPPGYDEELAGARSPEEAHAVMVKYGQPVHDLH